MRQVLNLQVQNNLFRLNMKAVNIFNMYTSTGDVADCDVNRQQLQLERDLSFTDRFHARAENVTEVELFRLPIA